MSNDDDNILRPPQWLIDEQRVNLRRATPAILLLARRLQIVAFSREEGGYGDGRGDPDLGGPFAPAPLYLEMAITLSQNPPLVTHLMQALEGLK
jgi:hypothetical protein